MGKGPDLRYERKLWRAGVEAVAGVDEAGVGPMAGPVVAAAALFPPELFIKGVNDSKKLSAEQRESLFGSIREKALSIGVGIVDVDEIDRLNIYWAAMLAMKRALGAMAVQPAHVLVDGRAIPGLVVPQTRIVGGDRKSFCIAAASIIAKVTRDRMMAEYDEHFPGYGFAEHKGYCTPEHLEILRTRGPSPIHRRSFAPVAAVLQMKLL
jgi:ribonuclease HII